MQQLMFFVHQCIINLTAIWLLYNYIYHVLIIDVIDVPSLICEEKHFLLYYFACPRSQMKVFELWEPLCNFLSPLFFCHFWT